MSESDTSVESIDNVASISAPAEFSIILLSKNRLKRQKTSHIAQISAKQRVEQLKNLDLYADGEILFCRVCEKTLDHSRKGTILRHFKSEIHIGNKKGGKENSKKRTTFKTTHPVKSEARLENLKTENLKTKPLRKKFKQFDFWKSNRMILPNLFDIVRQNAYLVGSSAGVERSFTYYSKILSDERHRLTGKTLEKLIFLYFDGSKFQIQLKINCFS